MEVWRVKKLFILHEETVYIIVESCFAVNRGLLRKIIADSMQKHIFAATIKEKERTNKRKRANRGTTKRDTKRNKLKLIIFNSFFNLFPPSIGFIS